MKFLKKEAHQCPFCGEQNNTEVVNLEGDGFNQVEVWKCSVCDNVWYAHYTITFDGIVVDDKLTEIEGDE